MNIVEIQEALDEFSRDLNQVFEPDAFVKYYASREKAVIAIKSLIEKQEAETQAMREALTLSRKHIGHLLQNPDKYKKTGETHEVLAKIDTVLKGGK